MAKEGKKRPISLAFSASAKSFLTSFYIIPIHLNRKSSQEHFPTHHISNWDFWFINNLHMVGVFTKWHLISEPTFSIEVF